MNVVAHKEFVFINTYGEKMSKKNRKKAYQEHRLLTKSEREAIINSYNNYKGNLGSIVVVVSVMLALLGILFAILGSYIKDIIFLYIVYCTIKAKINQVKKEPDRNFFQSG